MKHLCCKSRCHELMVKCLVAGLIYTINTEFGNDSRRCKWMSSAAVDLIKAHPVFDILSVLPEAGLTELHEKSDHIS